MAAEDGKPSRRSRSASSSSSIGSSNNVVDGTQAKRSRTGAHKQFDAEACFEKGLFGRADEMGGEFAAAKPFPHISIAPFCSEELLQGVRREMMERLHFTQKETDIFKYHQSGDLANLDGLPEDERQQLPCLQRLRDAIYSQQFRDLVSHITGCGPLSGSRTDMSTNRYKQGDHLLLHDDVIGDRRVSYIIYLADPEINDGRGWAPEDGGHLELYPRASETSWAPAVSPTRRLAPRWNQMVLFTVLPGESHHSVEEVAGAGKERLSIQGWFHFPQPGEPGYRADQMQRLWQSGAVSTLGQIEAKRQRATGLAGEDFAAYPDEAGATQNGNGNENEDQHQHEDELARYINRDYLDPKIMRQIADRFAEDSHIQLADFLSAETASTLSGWLRVVDLDDGAGTGDGGSAAPILPHGTGERGRWSAFGPPVIRRFLRLDGASSASTTSPEAERLASDLLGRLRDELFASGAFARWLERVTTLAPSAQRAMVRRFRPGLDYTLATPDGTASTTLDATLCLAHDAQRWVDGVVGGYQCYIDGGNEDASNDGSVYRQAGGEGDGDGDDGILLTTPAAWNTLTIALREPSVVKFVKYVSASAPGSRWDVSCEYAVGDNDSESDNDNGSDGVA